MSRPAASSSAAAAAAGDGPAIKATTYRPPTVAGLSTALLPARDSLGSMLATAPAAARKQARADAEERKEEEFAAANGENGNKRMRMTLSEEAAQQRAAAAAAAGGAAGSGSPALSSRVPPPMILSRSFSVPGAAAGGPLADAAAAAGDHGLGFDLNANVEDDFFDSIDPGSARNSLWNAQGLANLRANAVTTPVPAATTAAASSASAAAAASSAAAAADDAAFAQLTFPDPPLDWNLHSRIRFTSPSSFDWVSGSSSPAATDHALEGVQTFMALGRADACDCRNVSPLRELHHALSYSTFPASPFGKLHPLTSVLRTALNKPREQRGQMDQLQLTHLQRLWIQWEDSFRSLYYRTRLPPASPAWLDHFYSIHRGGPGSGGGLLTYCVLFLAADPDEAEGEDAEGPGAPGSLEKAPAALISRSNRGLRAMLTAKGVGFTMPNDPRSRSEKAANQSGSLDGAAMTDGPDPLSRQLSTQQQKRINQSIADEDLTCASVLLVQGRKDVHALFDTLLTQDRTSRELDLPALFAPAPFLNAVTRQVNILKVGHAKTNNTSEDKNNRMNGAGASSSGAGLDDVHTLDLAGPLLPSSVTRLLSLFRSTQSNGSFSAHFAPSDFPPSYFNCVGTDRVLSLDGLRCHPCLGLGGQESLASLTSAHLSGKARLRMVGSLRRVKATQDHFLVQLNAQQQTS